MSGRHGRNCWNCGTTNYIVRSIEGPGEPLADLYRQLLDRYPPFEEDPATPWGDSPMVLYFGDRLASVSIIASRVADALPFVTKTATGLGLTVFDVTGERIHRPDGEQALPVSLTADSPWRDRLDEHPERSTLSQPPAPGPEHDATRKNRAGMIVTGGAC